MPFTLLSLDLSRILSALSIYRTRIPDRIDNGPVSIHIVELLQNVGSGRDVSRYVVRAAVSIGFILKGRIGQLHRADTLVPSELATELVPTILSPGNFGTHPTFGNPAC